MRFPIKISHRSATAKIYGPSKKFPYYRVASTVAGRRQMQTFSSYPAAKEAAEKRVRDMASGSQAAALSAAQSRDALAAIQKLDAFFQSTGRRVSLMGAVSEFVEAAGKLHGRTMGEAIAGFFRSEANVQRKDIAEAVEEFLKLQAPLTTAPHGQRAQLSAKYHYNRANYLRRFAATFPNTPVCDLCKEHLDEFLESHSDKTAKTRNHYRTNIRQFLKWAVRKDYLPLTHRLNEADQMSPERANTAEVVCYSPDELAALLAASSGEMRVLVAIGGLAGLRVSELCRLDWAKVWRVDGHIEVTTGTAKTRARRLVEICPALSAWLESYRSCTTGKVWPLNENKFQKRFSKLCEVARVNGEPVLRKRNGLRHGYCTYHLALHTNENLTAAQSGNTPAIIHAHYKGLATKAEAEKWFAVMPKS